MTACALSSKAPTTSRELLRPRSTFAWRKDIAAHAVDRSARSREFIDAMPELEGDEPPLLALAHARDEGREHARARFPR